MTPANSTRRKRRRQPDLGWIVTAVLGDDIIWDHYHLKPSAEHEAKVKRENGWREVRLSRVVKVFK